MHQKDGLGSARNAGAANSQRLCAILCTLGILTLATYVFMRGDHEKLWAVFWR